MKDKIFADTNIVLDLLLERNPFYKASARLFSAAELNKVQISFSSLGFSILEHVISRQINKSKSKNALRKFRPLVKILAVDEKTIDYALNSDFRDFEDAIQYEVAIQNNQDLIISRNIKDFKNSVIPVMTPEDFIRIKNL